MCRHVLPHTGHVERDLDLQRTPRHGQFRIRFWFPASFCSRWCFFLSVVLAVISAFPRPAQYLCGSVTHDGRLVRPERSPFCQLVDVDVFGARDRFGRRFKSGRHDRFGDERPACVKNGRTAFVSVYHDLIRISLGLSFSLTCIIFFVSTWMFSLLIRLRAMDMRIQCNTLFFGCTRWRGG